MPRRAHSLIAAAVVLLIAGVGITQRGAQTEALATPTSRADVVAYLNSISGNHLLSGTYSDDDAPNAWTQKYHDITGRYPGLWSTDFLFGSQHVASRQRIVDQGKVEWANGSVVALSFHACPPTVGSVCDWTRDIIKPLSDSDWNQVVTDGTALNGAWKRRLDETVPYLQQLKDAGVPVLFRPVHEMNDGWSWWGGRPGANGSRRLYQITHDYLANTKGLSNLVWVWNVKDIDGGEGHVADYWPGAGYVDVATLDAWTHRQPTPSWYDALRNVAPGKPVALAEVGSVPAPATLSAQPRWAYFMVWAAWLTDPAWNTDADVRTTSNDGRVLDQGEVVIPRGTPTTTTTTPPTPGTGPLTGLAGKCLDINASQTANGTKIQLYTCNGTAAQRWTVGADGTIRGLGKCLDVNGGINADGTVVHLWDCLAGNAHQQWVWSASARTLVNPETGRCLDAAGQSSADGTQIQIWSCNGQTNQQWVLPAGSTPPTPGVGPVTGLAGKCLDVAASQSTNGTTIQLYSCNGTAAQRWTIGTDGTIRALGKCLDVNGGINADGTKVHLWDCLAGNTHQQWRVDATAKSLVNPETGKCLDVTGQATADATPLEIWTCSGWTNQQWTLPAGSKLPAAGTPPPPPPPPPPATKLPGAPYLYLGWGSPPSATTVMQQTGVKAFTMAFMLSGGGCTAKWDGWRDLAGGVDAQTIAAIKAAGGNVQISFGGASGTKLGTSCSTAAAFAGAVQSVIDAYHPAAVDFDIESDEFESAAVQDRILGAIPTIKARNAGTKVVITFPIDKAGPTYWGTRLISQAKALGATVDNWTSMPFDFGSGNMYADTVSATEALKSTVKSTFGLTDAQAYARTGISGMNGLSDQQEQTSVATWTQIRDYARSRGLGRLAFWSVNRDRPCPGGGVSETCSGVAQNAWDFTRLTAGF